MDGYQLTASLVSSLTGLAWPLVVGIGIILFRDKINQLIRGFRLKYGEAELTLIDVVEKDIKEEVAKEEIKQVLEISEADKRSLAVLDSNAIEDEIEKGRARKFRNMISNVERNADRLIVSRTHRQLTSAIVAAANRAGYGTGEGDPIAYLFDKGILNERLASSSRYLVGLGRKLIGREIDLDQEELDRYRPLALEVINILENNQTSFKKG